MTDRTSVPPKRDSIQTVRFTADEMEEVRLFLAAKNQKFQPFALKLIMDAVRSGKRVEPADPALTPDQIDALAILAENPKRGLLFQAVQTTVKHALEEYREKFKPKRDPKETTGPVHHKRTAT